LSVKFIDQTFNIVQCSRAHTPENLLTHPHLRTTDLCYNSTGEVPQEQSSQICSQSILQVIGFALIKHLQSCKLQA